MEHQIVFVKFEDDPGIVYAQIHLTTHRNFFQRLWRGLGYAFGYRSRFGDWDEVILSEKSLEEIQNFLANYNKS